METLDVLENVDDDLDRISVGMVKISEPEAFKEWGITGSSGVLYFENGIPNTYSGDLSNERELLKWVKKQFEGDDIEDVTSHVMEKIVKGEVGNKETYGEHDDAAILFYKRGDAFSSKILKALENIDDDCDQHGIIFVKIGDEIKAQSLGISDLPTLVYFEDNIPNIYTGDLRVERDVLDWLVEQLESDEIEEVTDEILDNLIEHHPVLIAVFYDADDKTSLKCLSALESIDDDLDEHNIPAVKMSDTMEARQYGVKTFPSIIVFVKKIPELYQGDVSDEAAVLGWALTQAGIKVESEEEDDEENDILSFPSASAEKNCFAYS